MTRQLRPVVLRPAERAIVKLHAWSPWQAEMVTGAIRWMAAGGWRSLGRPVYGGRFRWYLVPRTTQAIVYWVRDDELRVVWVRDLRRRRRQAPH